MQSPILKKNIAPYKFGSGCEYTGTAKVFEIMFTDVCYHSAKYTVRKRDHL